MYSFSRACVSAQLIPAVSTRISTSPSPGSGTGRSATCITSGPPNSSIWIARMGAAGYSSVAAFAQEPVERLHELRAVRAWPLQPPVPRLAPEVVERSCALAEVVLVGGPGRGRAELGAVAAAASALVHAKPALGIRLDLLGEALGDVGELARGPAKDLYGQAG